MNPSRMIALARAGGTYHVLQSGGEVDHLAGAEVVVGCL